ncbi:methyltransferase [Scheffersomyces xylosifermentans]|uniref:methyltransferase n=1 Tax=Scheffersomyces xylosifermentans TaxID=1304137 RepID=UPI00315D071B
MSDKHKEAIAANLKAFTADFATKYDKLDAINALSMLAAKSMLEFDPSKPRKTKKESEPVRGDPSKPFSGFTVENTLPDPSTFAEKFPHSAFKPGMKLMDFACGTGLVTMKLAPYLQKKGVLTEVVGVDINKDFLARFNSKAQDVVSDELSIKSHVYDILDPEVQSELDEKFGAKFDVIICTYSYHHLDSYRDVTKKLASFLRPGGWIYIVDFYNEDLEKNWQTADPGSSVRHMGGLKVDVLNDTLTNFCGLTNASSAREGRAKLWQPKVFIESHTTQDTIDKLARDELPSKDDGEVYLIDNSYIMAVAQAKR